MCVSEELVRFEFQGYHCPKKCAQDMLNSSNSSSLTSLDGDAVGTVVGLDEGETDGEREGDDVG